MVVFLYLWKVDSFNGRVLIWEGVLRMIFDNPVGYGIGGFQKEYMEYQAHLLQNKGVYWQNLADDVFHPFNEFLKIIVEFGIPVFVCLLLFITKYCMRLYKSTNRVDVLCLELVIALVLVASFSYPLYYPITWYVIGGIIGFSNHGKLYHFRLPITIKCFLNIVVVGGFLFVCTIIYHYYTWNRVLNNAPSESVSSKTYLMLNPILQQDARFLYTYAAILNENQDYYGSIFYLQKALDKLNSYDIQLLMADNYKNNGQYDLEEKHLKYAAAMCPNRFLPLYHLVKLYDRKGDKVKALQMAKEIISKDIKVPSLTVRKIKNEIYNYIYQ